MRILTVALFLNLVLFHGLYATHIVGGEFELLHISGDRYRLSLKMYFDKVNGNPEILTNPADQSIFAYIFSKATNKSVSIHPLQKTSTSEVNYTNPECTSGDLKTLLLIYSSEIYLDATYNEPEGYYVVWERCCRNEVINNIESPGGTGQAFYMEFPPVTRNGVPFINSSPSLFPALNDYGCVNKPFYYNFAGMDKDGDSLVYSLVTPYAGVSSIFNVIPNPSPAPYKEVRWIEGVDGDNMIPGLPSLTINPNSGRLFVVPRNQGLYVFGVKCEEYRDGKKIGEVRRDFQLLILDCQPNDPPQISVRPPVDKTFIGKKDTVHFKIGEERCFNFSVKDKQANSKLTVTLQPLNFDNFFSETTYSKDLKSTSDSLTFQLCFPDCPLPDKVPYILQIIAKDNGCSLPLLDTAVLIVHVEPLLNDPATIITDPSIDEIRVKAGTQVHFDVVGNDGDQTDSLYLKVLPVGFDMQKAKMNFAETAGVGNISSSFTWSTDCDFLNLNEKDSYELDFILEEVDGCQLRYERIKRVKIILEADPDYAPEISVDKTFDNNTLTAFVGDKIRFDVKGIDPDGKFIKLYAVPKHFSLSEAGMSFDHVQGTGVVASLFQWDVTCDYLRDSAYELVFVAEDKSCFGRQLDTIPLKIFVKDYDQDSKEFLPPNVFTPNGDGINDVFTLDNLPLSNELDISSLPEDGCGNKFEGITIVNRWGVMVFEDKRRNFEWTGLKVPTGTYFYTIKFSRRSFKGTISVLY